MIITEWFKQNVNYIIIRDNEVKIDLLLYVIFCGQITLWLSHRI